MQGGGILKMDEKRIEELSKRPFAKTFPKAMEAIKNNICPTCGREIKFGARDQFKDEISRREYRISGMCQKCQDSVFDVEEGY
jgi:uncharacterized protein with PIN domain